MLCSARPSALPKLQQATSPHWAVLQPSSHAGPPRRLAAAAAPRRTGRRRLGARARAQAEYQDLLSTLQTLGDDELAEWAAQHRQRLTLPFLGWLSDEELAASSADPDQQQRLWELGSKLMALREGLSPVGNEVLQAELRAAALRCSCSGSMDDGDDDSGDEEEGNAGSTAGAGEDAQRQQQQAALASPAFSSAVQQIAALGLSPEGMVLFQQQAAALAAVVGVSRARSLTEVVGRAKVQSQRQLHSMAEADAAVRILDVLLSVPERVERAALLPDAFTPSASRADVDDDAAYFSPDEDQVYTTPLRLLHAIDLYLARLRGSSTPAGQHVPALVSGGLGLSLAQLKAVLLELREDVEAYALGGEGDSC